MTFQSKRLALAREALADLSERQRTRPGISMSRWRDLALTCTAKEDELCAKQRDFVARLIPRESITRDEFAALCDISTRLGIL